MTIEAQNAYHAEMGEMSDGMPGLSGFTGHGFPRYDYALHRIVVQHVLVGAVGNAEYVRLVVWPRFEFVFVVILRVKGRNSIILSNGYYRALSILIKIQFRWEKSLMQLAESLSV